MCVKGAEVTGSAKPKKCKAAAARGVKSENFQSNSTRWLHLITCVSVIDDRKVTDYLEREKVFFL